MICFISGRAVRAELGTGALGVPLSTRGFRCLRDLFAFDAVFTLYTRLADARVHSLVHLRVLWIVIYR